MDYVKKPYTEQEFEQKVDALRGDLAKKLNRWADRIQVSMSYTPKVARVEGEVWKEDGKEYIFQNGIKQSTHPMHSARMPHWCPKCSLPMNHRFDRKFFYIRGHCYNCNIEWEGQMRLDGTWEAFEKRMLRENEKAWLKDKIEEQIQYMKDFTVPTVYYENGGFDRLADRSMFDELFKTMEDDIELCFRRLDVIRQEETAEEVTHDKTTEITSTI